MYLPVAWKIAIPVDGATHVNQMVPAELDHNYSPGSLLASFELWVCSKLGRDGKAIGLAKLSLIG